MRTALLACVLAGVSLPAGAVPGAAASSKPVAVTSFDRRASAARRRAGT
jgi:hypothetical protein